MNIYIEIGKNLRKLIEQCYPNERFDDLLDSAKDILMAFIHGKEIDQIEIEKTLFEGGDGMHITIRKRNRERIEEKSKGSEE